MAAYLDLYVDTALRDLVTGPLNSSRVAAPTFTQGNTVTLRIRCLLPAANWPNSNPPYTLIPNTGKTLQVAIGAKVGNTSLHYTEQYTWSLSTDAADPYFYADLPMNTDAITTLLASNEFTNAFLEINLVDGGVPQTIYSKSVRIEASVIKPDSVVVPAGQTPLSAEVAAATYLQREITGPITLKSADGSKSVSLYVETDGTFHADPLT